MICKRLLILTLVIALAWFTVYRVYPFVDTNLPLIFAIILTYSFIAYIGLPTLWRVWQALHKPTHVPTRTMAADGWAVDPINIVIIARSEHEFAAAMHKAGWLIADDKNIKTSLRMVYAILFNKRYAHAPFNNCYVFGRKQDLGFQIPISKSPRHRHHVRFWRLAQTKLDNQELEQQGFWRKILKKFLTKKKEIWVGAAVSDNGISIQRRNLQINHGIQSDTTIEREFLVGSLQKAGVISDCIDIKAGEPLHTRHQGFGEKIIADGYVKLCELKRQAITPGVTRSKRNRRTTKRSARLR